MIDPIIAILEIRAEICVDHGGVCLRVNVRIAAALVFLCEIRHILAYPHDLACPNRRMRVTHSLLIRSKKVPEHRHTFREGIRRFGVNALGYVLEAFKIKKL